MPWDQGNLCSIFLGQERSKLFDVCYEYSFTIQQRPILLTPKMKMPQGQALLKCFLAKKGLGFFQYAALIF